MAADLLVASSGDGTRPEPLPGGAPPRNGAEALVAVLVSHGVDVVFLNPGTDTAPVQEAFATLTEAGVPVPRVVLCRHESVALAAAHAYFAVTGRPQVVMVHVDVGTQNLGAMLHNAARAEAGVVIIAGLTPVTSHGERPGGRDLVVHWQQDVADQAGIVGPYVKWAGELRSADTVTPTLARAFQVAAAAPAGPVYVTVAREVLMESPTAGHRPARRRAVPAAAAPDPAALEHAAQLLAAGSRPVLITTRLGRRPEAVSELVRVAELLGAPVVDRRERMNFPSTHPCYLTDPQDAREALTTADVVLLVDCDVPWVPARSAPPESATVIQLDADPVKTAMPGWDFPVDLSLQADPLLGLRQLAAALTDLAAAGRLRPRDLPARAAARPPAVGDRLSVQHVLAALDRLLRPEDIVLDESVTSTEAVRAGLTRTLPGSLFQSGGSGLGWAVPGAIGVRLACPARRVIAIVGDGTFLFSSPTAALLTARDAAAPFLAVVLANGGYAASARPVHELFPEGASRRAGEVVGTRFPEAPDMALLAGACHARGEDVHAAAGIEPALGRGLAELDAGRSAVVVAHVDSPWLPRPDSTPSPTPTPPETSRGDLP